ncbi:MAG: flagellar biosynthesis anti-sigma factor FlgM [Nitrospinaceae bacterium]
MEEIKPPSKTTRRTAINRPVASGKKIKNSPTPPGKEDRVTLSKVSKVPTSRSGEIRRDLVTKFKAVLQDGGYRIKADEIAEKMVQKIKDNKDPSFY